MSFFYVLRPIRDNINETPKEGFRAKAVSLGTMEIDCIIEKLTDRSTFSEGEVRGIIYCLVSEIEQALASGYNVNIDRLGTFSVAATSRLVSNKQEIRSGTIEFNGVNFRPCMTMKRKLARVGFERLPQEMNYKKKPRHKRY